MIQNNLRFLFLTVFGFSSGLLVSAGVFTVLLAVGLTPRFVGKTHTGKKIFLYESCIMAGAVIGTVFSTVSATQETGRKLREWIVTWEPESKPMLDAVKIMKAGPVLAVTDITGQIFLAIAGIFMGMFVGCLALAIAEMLNSIPIFARRTSYRHGLGLAVLAVALGKLAGSLYYFWQGCFFPG